MKKNARYIMIILLCVDCLITGGCAGRYPWYIAAAIGFGFTVYSLLCVLLGTFLEF